MNGRLRQIGFNQRIRLEWLEKTAYLVLACNGKETIYNSLQELLQDKLSVGGTAKRGNREKAISILMKIWVNAPKGLPRTLGKVRGLDTLRDMGLNLLKTSPQNDHITIHWGMVMAVYPFWSAVAKTTGRLLRLQDNVAAAQVQRRIREIFGEQETVSRATRRVLRSFIDWEVLKEGSAKGIYQQGNIRTITDVQLIAWLIEAVLISRGDNTASFRTIIHSPSLFPFNIVLPASKVLEENSRLEFFRHGLDEEIVTFRKENNSSQNKDFIIAKAVQNKGH